VNTMLCSLGGLESKESKTRIKNALNRSRGHPGGGQPHSGTVSVFYQEPATEMSIKKLYRKERI
jgi:hypothetical protein